MHRNTTMRRIRRLIKKKVRQSKWYKQDVKYAEWRTKEEMIRFYSSRYRDRGYKVN